MAITSLGLSSTQQKRACKYMPLIVEQSIKHNIDPSVAVSMIFIESSFNPWVVSHAGACGLTQIIPKYTGKYSPVRKYTCNQLKNPYISIRAGLKILKYLAQNAEGDMDRALCSYNAGVRGCRRGWKNPSIMGYVKRARKAQKKLHARMGHKPYGRNELLHCTVDVCPGVLCPCSYGNNNILYLNNE
jgi:soluble lytic murein transglycosylase-like protein